MCARVCVCVFSTEREEEKKTRGTQRYLSCGDTRDLVSLRIARVVHLSCQVLACKTICANRYREIPSNDETNWRSIVRNSKRSYIHRLLDDDGLAVVAVEMTTRLVARPEDDDDDDEVHEEERDSVVGYHCH